MKRISWMSPIDYHILEFYRHHDISATPKVISINIEYEKQYVGRRCRTLVEAGLLNRTERGVYELTDDGRAFLAGELSADDLEDRLS